MTAIETLGIVAFLLVWAGVGVGSVLLVARAGEWRLTLRKDADLLALAAVFGLIAGVVALLLWGALWYVGRGR